MVLVQSQASCDANPDGMQTPPFYRYLGFHASDPKFKPGLLNRNTPLNEKTRAPNGSSKPVYHYYVWPLHQLQVSKLFPQSDSGRVQPSFDRSDWASESITHFNQGLSVEIKGDQG